MTQQDPLHKLLSTGDAAGARVLLAEEDLSVKYSRDSLLAALMWASEHGETRAYPIFWRHAPRRPAWTQTAPF